MKTHRKTFAQWGLIIGVVVLLFVFSSLAQDRAHNAVVAIVLPGTEVSDADFNAMNDVLAKYDTHLYKIKVYKEGKLVETKGNLKEIITDKKIASLIAENIKKKGFTHIALQVGMSVNPLKPRPPADPTKPKGDGSESSPSASPVPSPMPSPSASGAPIGGGGTNPQKPPQWELIQDLKPILEKYLAPAPTAEKAPEKAS